MHTKIEIAKPRSKKQTLNVESHQRSQKTPRSNQRERQKERYLRDPQREREGEIKLNGNNLKKKFGKIVK